MSDERNRTLTAAVSVLLPALLSGYALTVAWPYTWPGALARPLLAIGRHGDPLLAIGAVAGTAETLTAWAWGDAPLVVASAVFFAGVSAASAYSLFGRPRVETTLARLIARVNAPAVETHTDADGGP